MDDLKHRLVVDLRLGPNNLQNEKGKEEGAYDPRGGEHIDEEVGCSNATYANPNAVRAHEGLHRPFVPIRALCERFRLSLLENHGVKEAKERIARLFERQNEEQAYKTEGRDRSELPKRLALIVFALSVQPLGGIPNI